ncbi:hypothetical protein ACTTAL_07260 [Rhodobacter capsulatus]|uniref:hypothetical protein n=1 Tax=Rhodobacter capsulatus TaxID=1061 RepID=UPI0003D3AF14|nr:hypothetical protein [Rhodobacter capsulatus]ETD90852.1 hypothetical protein U713_03955 [Rhodobacter capsulatus YW2]
MTEISRANLKRAILARLDGFAREHRIGHQRAKANRYAMRSQNGAPIELMFEKEPETEPHLWVLAAQADSIPVGSLVAESYPKSELYKVPAKGGGMQYGRHSALEDMTLLGRADLVRFTLRSIADLDVVLSAVMQAKRQGCGGE